MHGSLGHYRIVEQIGSGGMGVVYRARDEHLERDVAVKVLSSASLPDEHTRRRFRREALALSKLNHPNIATIHDFDTFDDVDVLVMEHIPGSDLDELLRPGPLPEREVVRLGRQLATALETAHQHGIVHRDLKPGNVRITGDGHLKVLDFGLAQAALAGGDSTTHSLTNTAFAGTLPYMAPEQVRGGPVDHRTDIYGAGAVLYEMATGSRVYPGLTGARLLGAVLEETPIPARSLNPRISPALEQILAKALDKDAQLRYQSARELKVDLERLESAHGGEAARRPRRWGVIAAALLVLAMLAGAVWYLWPGEAPFPGRILMADFDSEGADPSLASVVRQGLTVKLQQSRTLNLLSREQVVDALRRMERTGDQPLDRQTALELAQREGIPLVLAGTVHQRGDALWVSVTAMDPMTRDVRFTDTAEFQNEAGVFKGLDALAGSLRRNLGESLVGIAQSNEPLADVTTQSIPALKLYTAANDRLAHGDADGALPLLLQAVQADPTFAMAHRLLARIYGSRGNVAEAREHVTLAYEHRDKLSQKERLHVEAAYYRARGEYERAVDTLAAAANLFPADLEFRYELALAYRDAGQRAKAVEQLEALAGDPYYSVAYGTLALQFVRDGDPARARAVYEQARERSVKLPQLEWAYGLVLLGDGQIDQARERFRALESASQLHAGIAGLYLANADILEARFDAAAERLQADLALDQRQNDVRAEVKRRYVLGQLSLLRGGREDAAIQLRAMLGGDGERLGQDEALMAGSLALALGDRRRAEQMLARLERLRAEAPSAFAESCYHALSGEIALAEGRGADAAERFRTAQRQYPSAMFRRGLARAFGAQEEWARAREAWQGVVDARGELLLEGLALDWVLAHLELARATVRAGDPAAAAAHYDRFLERWKADGALAPIRAAVAERQALEGY